MTLKMLLFSRSDLAGHKKIEKQLNKSGLICKPVALWLHETKVFWICSYVIIYINDLNNNGCMHHSIFGHIA